jgi:glycosyltransferase involved in cell wall biosynthesis
MSDPSFSIVAPTFRRPDALRKTLQAVLSVEYEPGRYEVIVVDDGDDDSTARVIDALEDRGCADATRATAPAWGRACA